MKSKEQIKKLEERVGALEYYITTLINRAFSETARNNYPDPSILLKEISIIQQLYCSFFYAGLFPEGIPLPTIELNDTDDAKAYIAKLYTVEVDDLDLIGLTYPNSRMCSFCDCDKIQFK